MPYEPSEKVILCLNMNINMSKTITIRNAVYDELLMVKKKGESFSELLERLAKSEDRKQLLLSIRGSVTFTDKKKMMEEIEESRWEKRA